MNKPKRTSIHQMLAEQKEASIPEQPAELQLLEAFENARDAAEYLGTLVRKDFEEVDSIHLTEAQIAEQNAFVKQLMGGFDEDEPTPAPTPPLSTCAIAPTSTGHKLTLQVESDADLHSLTTWLLECLESLPRLTPTNPPHPTTKNPHHPAAERRFSYIWSQQMNYFYAPAALTMIFWFSLAFLIHLG